MRRAFVLVMFVDIVACAARPSSRAADWIGPGERPRAEAPHASAEPDRTDAGVESADDESPGGAPVEIRLHEAARPVRRRAPARTAAAEPTDVPVELGPDLFRNTYYDFPTEDDGPKTATVYDAKCTAIARVSDTFHDALCVQGSGRLASGATVSFARRDCACAAVCPRTGERICYERLDAARFPNGRGATGHPITPLRTVAVDTSVIPLGTVLFIPELAGMPLAGGGRHDGCFVAEDRGIAVVGRQIDIFTGDPAMTARWNALYPSNRGIHVAPRDPRCAPHAPSGAAATRRGR